MSVHKVGDNGARESLVLGVAVKTCHNILDGRRLIWFPVFASRFNNEVRQPKVEKLNIWMFEKITRIYIPQEASYEKLKTPGYTLVILP